jgi:hypothetical protein
MAVKVYSRGRVEGVFGVVGVQLLKEQQQLIRWAELAFLMWRCHWHSWNGDMEPATGKPVRFKMPRK